jgi:hypothetical protein
VQAANLVSPTPQLRQRRHSGESGQNLAVRTSSGVSCNKSRALLTLAGLEHSWVEGLDKIWLRVKYVENAFTHSEPKLRIVSASYDKNRFYVATNQSLTRFSGDDSWLASLPVGIVTRHRTGIKLKIKRPAPALPKFKSEEMPAELAAVRLQPGAEQPVAYLIILANMAFASDDS